MCTRQGHHRCHGYRDVTRCSRLIDKQLTLIIEFSFPVSACIPGPCPLRVVGANVRAHPTCPASALYVRCSARVCTPNWGQPVLLQNADEDSAHRWIGLVQSDPVWFSQVHGKNLDIGTVEVGMGDFGQTAVYPIHFVILDIQSDSRRV